ncbi:MAG: hypothetical protein ACRBK7_31880 [Acidimicrobiales bacterium]
MRRGFASLIIGLSLLVASASWGGFVLSRTVLDPGRSERLADQLLENPEVRQALVSRLADTLKDQIPREIPVRDQLLQAGAEQALDDPRVEALIRDGFVRVHQNALEGNSEPVIIDAGALGSAGRDALVAARPELDAVLPASPTVELELPTTGFTWIATAKRLVDRFTRLGAMLALFGAGISFAIAKNRAAVLRRVAFWGYGASAFWLLMGYGIPWVAANLSPTSAAIASAAVDVFFGAMIRPAVIMAIMATVLLVAGFVLPAFAPRRGAATLQPRRSGGAVTGIPVAAARAVNQPGQAASGAQQPDSTDRMPIPVKPIPVEMTFNDGSTVKAAKVTPVVTRRSSGRRATPQSRP